MAFRGSPDEIWAINAFYYRFWYMLLALRVEDWKISKQIGVSPSLSPCLYDCSFAFMRGIILLLAWHVRTCFVLIKWR